MAALLQAGFNPGDEATTVGQLTDQEEGSPQDVLNAVRDSYPEHTGLGTHHRPTGRWLAALDGPVALVVSECGCHPAAPV